MKIRKIRLCMTGLGIIAIAGILLVTKSPLLPERAAPLFSSASTPFPENEQMLKEMERLMTQQDLLSKINPAAGEEKFPDTAPRAHP